MLPKDLLQYLEKGDRTMEMLTKKEITSTSALTDDMMRMAWQSMRFGDSVTIPRW